MELSSPFVQHQQFQLYRLPASDVEENTGKDRRRKTRGQVKADDELGIEKHGRGFNSAEVDFIYNPGSLRADSHGLGLIAGTGRPVSEDSNKSDAAWSSPGWQTGARSSAGAWRPAALSTSPNQNPSAG